MYFKLLASNLHIISSNLHLLHQTDQRSNLPLWLKGLAHLPPAYTCEAWVPFSVCGWGAGVQLLQCSLLLDLFSSCMWFPLTYIPCTKLIKRAISLCGWNVWHNLCGSSSGLHLWNLLSVCGWEWVFCWILLLCGGEQGMCKHTMGLLLADKHQTVPMMLYTILSTRKKVFCGILVLDLGRKCKVPSRPHMLL